MALLLLGRLALGFPSRSLGELPQIVKRSGDVFICAVMDAINMFRVRAMTLRPLRGTPMLSPERFILDSSSIAI